MTIIAHVTWIIVIWCALGIIGMLMIHRWISNIERDMRKFPMPSDRELRVGLISLCSDMERGPWYIWLLAGPLWFILGFVSLFVVRGLK